MHTCQALSEDVDNASTNLLSNGHIVRVEKLESTPGWFSLFKDAMQSLENRKQSERVDVKVQVHADRGWLRGVPELRKGHSWSRGKRAYHSGTDSPVKHASHNGLTEHPVNDAEPEPNPPKADRVTSTLTAREMISSRYFDWFMLMSAAVNCVALALFDPVIPN